MKLIIASNNKHKIYEIKKMLGSKFSEILSLNEANISHETVEDGETFIENAFKKAREIAEISGCASLADDSGICVDALDGAPGVYSARFSGGDDEDNNKLLLKKLEGREDRGAHYTCAMALVYPDGKEISAEGYMYGEITDSPRGERGFGYDEKNAISHRANALAAILEKIKGI